MATQADFLAALFEPYFLEHKGFIEVRVINDGFVKSVFCPSIEELKDKIFTLKGNIYFGACPRTTSGDGTKRSVKHILAIWCDIDFGEEGHKQRSKWNNEEEALEAIQDFEFHPSVIVSTGHGFQCYWLLNEPQEIEDIVSVEGVMRGVSGHLGGDVTHDVSRVLRVPETKNLKVQDKPKIATIVYFDKSLRYNLSDFEDYEVPVVESISQTVIFDQVLPGIDIRALRVSDRIRNLIEFGDTEKRYRSRSESDLAVIAALVSAGCSDIEIKAIFSNPGHKISAKYLEKGKYSDRYLAHSIGKARTQEKRLEANSAQEQALTSLPLSLPDFLKQDIPPVEYYIEGFLQKQGKTMISAKTNIGKSILVQNLAIAMTTGQTKLLGRFCVVSAKVLYLDLEMGDSSLKERFKTMVAKDALEAPFLYVKHIPDLDLLDEQWQQRLEKWVADLDINVLIIDPIGDAWSGDENNKQEVGGLTTYLNTVMSKYNISILVVHHWRKVSKDFKSGGEMAAGSYKWAAWLDVHTTLEGSVDNLIVHCHKSRNKERFSPLMIKLNPENLTFEFLADFERKFTEATLLELFDSFTSERVAVPDLIKRAKEQRKGSKDTIRKLIAESTQLEVDRTQKTYYLFKKPKEKGQGSEENEASDGINQ